MPPGAQHIDWDLDHYISRGHGLPGAGLLAVLHRHKEDVLGLQVCVYEIQVMQVRHALQQLLPKGPNLQMQIMLTT